MNVYERRNVMLGVEFDRYVREHPAFAARIPRKAQIILQIPGDTMSNTWARRLAERQREDGQPMVYVTVKRLQAPRFRLVSPGCKSKQPRRGALGGRTVGGWGARGRGETGNRARRRRGFALAA